MASFSNAAGITAEKIELMECPFCDAPLDVSGNDVLQEFACPSCEHIVTTPGRFGDFIIVRKLGAGGMGAVFLAIDERLGREVALKITRKEFGQNPKFLERFANEAQAMARFNHPNVVQIYNFGNEYGQPYMVTEYVTGGSLADQMEEGEGLDQVSILEVARDLAAGLQAAQDNGLVHGDIKPDNIMFDDRGNAKIMDFGLAKFASEDGEKPKEVWGTPFYIAPEKARKKGEDYQSDQYSLGATLYHAMAGQPPFDGATPTDVVVARLKDDAVPLHKINSYVSKKASKIIQRMMSRSPSTRYPTYASMRSDLDAAIRDAQANPGPYDPEEEEVVGSSHAKNKFPILPIALGVGGLLAIILTIVALSGGGEDPAPPPKPPPGTTTAGGPTITQKMVNDNQPFTSLRSGSLQRAGKNYEGGGFTSAETQMRDLQARLEPDRIGAQWVTLMLGMSGMAQNSRAASADLKTAMNMQIDYTEQNAPYCNPADFARMLLGDRNMDIPKFSRIAQRFPPKLKEFASFAKGLRWMRTGHFDEAVKNFDDYLRFTPQKNDWMLSMQPLAKYLRPKAHALSGQIAEHASKTRQEKIRAYEDLLNRTSDKTLKTGLERLVKRTKNGS